MAWTEQSPSIWNGQEPAPSPRYSGERVGERGLVPSNVDPRTNGSSPLSPALPPTAARLPPGRGSDDTNAASSIVVTYSRCPNSSNRQQRPDAEHLGLRASISI